MQQLTSADDIKKLGTILGIWAHPDDETYVAGGIMAAAARNGQKVICITATKGEKGVQDEKLWPLAELAEIRSRELKKAHEILGVSQNNWLGIPDGECKQQNFGHMRSELMDMVMNFKPDTILTFGPDGMTGHLDHQAVSAWATEAGRSLEIPVYHAAATDLFYTMYQDACAEATSNHRPVDDMFINIYQPSIVADEDCEILIQLSDELWQKKLKALKAMPSQTEKFIASLGDNYYRLIFRNEAFVRAKN